MNICSLRHTFYRLQFAQNCLGRGPNRFRNPPGITESTIRASFKGRPAMKVRACPNSGLDLQKHGVISSQPVSASADERVKVFHSGHGCTTGQPYNMVFERLW